MKLTSWKTGQILFEDKTIRTLRACLHAAVRGSIDLAYVNLRKTNLRGARLDGAKLKGASLWRTDFSNADLAGACLDNADMRGAILKDTCLAESTLRCADLSGACFSGTIVTDADFSGAAFSCPTLFTLDLTSARSFEGASYWHKGETRCPLTCPPSILKTPRGTVIALDQHIISESALYLKNTTFAMHRENEDR